MLPIPLLYPMGKLRGRPCTSEVVGQSHSSGHEIFALLGGWQMARWYIEIQNSLHTIRYPSSAVRSTSPWRGELLNWLNDQFGVVICIHYPRPLHSKN